MGIPISIEEERIVFNYQYYDTIKKRIKNLGDCLYEQNKFKEARKYYEQKALETLDLEEKVRMLAKQAMSIFYMGEL